MLKYKEIKIMNKHIYTNINVMKKLYFLYFVHLYNNEKYTETDINILQMNILDNNNIHI